MTTLQLVIEFIVGLAIIVFLHEFGHFIACKLIGIPVEEFGFGFPPRALTLFESGGTKFTLNWIPFGGFVRPKGEQDSSVEGGLAAANPWKRIGVFIAGPTMNIIIALILFVFIYDILGFLPDRNHVQVESIVAGLPASATGLQPGDILVSIDGVAIHSLDTAHNTIYANLGKPLDFVYQHNGVDHEVTITPLSNPTSEGAVGILMSYPSKPFTILGAIPESFTSLGDYLKQLYATLVAMIQGQSSSSSSGRLVGFKGMYDLYAFVVSSSSSTGVPIIANALFFFASISISLGIMNLLPIPALDGGRIVFALPEIIIRRRIPEKYENWVMFISFALLILLMIFINAQDFINPITTPVP
jgi:regulator of sigma E protease